MLEVHQQLKHQHVQAWLQLLAAAGPFSELFQATVSSDTPDLHQARVVARFAPSTLLLTLGLGRLGLTSAPAIKPALINLL